MKKQVHLAAACALLLINARCKTPETNIDCRAVMCTMEFRMLNIVLKDKAGYFYKADKVETYNEAGKLIFSQNAPNNLPDTNYTVIDDGNLKDLKRNIDNHLEFKVYKGAVVVKTIKYVVTADCCHISKVKGDAEVLVE